MILKLIYKSNFNYDYNNNLELKRYFQFLKNINLLKIFII